MTESSFLRDQNRMRDRATLKMCEEHGAHHRSYNWGWSPWGHWTNEQKKAYADGFYGRGEWVQDETQIETGHANGIKGKDWNHKIIGK